MIFSEKLVAIVTLSYVASRLPTAEGKLLHVPCAACACHKSYTGCVENDVRLNISEYDTSEEYGVVVLCVDGMEVRVCGDEWTSKETMVICRQLGFPPGLHVHLHACRHVCMYVNHCHMQPSHRIAVMLICSVIKKSTQ